MLVLRPLDLDTTCTIALLQEEAGPQTSTRMPHSGDWSLAKLAASPCGTLQLPAPQGPEKPATATTTTSTPVDAKMAAIMSYHRALGLCYKCNAKWSKDHQCAPEVLHAVQALWESVNLEDFQETEVSDVEAPEQLFLAISKAALTGLPASCTVQLLDSIRDVPVQILVDSSSSSSFINSDLVSRLPAVQSVPISASVQIASGGLLHSSQLLHQVCWTVDQCSFRSDFRVLPLAAFDVVIGMDWLESFSPMQVHWRQKWLAIPYNGQTQLLQGQSSEAPAQILLQVEAVSNIGGLSEDPVVLPPAIQCCRILRRSSVRLRHCHPLAPAISKSADP